MEATHDIEARARITIRGRLGEGGLCAPAHDQAPGEVAAPAPAQAGELAEEYDVTDPRQLGRLGEEIAVRYLAERGFDVVARNWRCRYGEADVVARSEDETVLVEVKTRLGQDVDPLEAVIGRKQQAYRRIGLAYLMEHDELESVRFDVIGINVTRPGLARLRHLIGAYQWDS